MSKPDRKAPEYDEELLPPKKRLCRQSLEPQQQDASRHSQQILEETLARDRAIRDMQELAALERRRRRLLYELRLNGEEPDSDGRKPAATAGAEERALLSTLARITALLAGQNWAAGGSQLVGNQSPKLTKPTAQKQEQQEPQPKQQLSLLGKNIAVSGYD